MVATSLDATVDQKIAAARAAIGRCDWGAARKEAERSLGLRETAEGHELIGLACWWLSDADMLFASRERAYRLYLAAGNVRRAARMATWLDWDTRAFRGAPAVANGWLRRARRLLDGHHECAEYGWLLLREADALLHHDAAGAAKTAGAAAELGRRNADPDLEFIALSLQGLALVAAGQVGDGMEQLDEATTAVVAGEFADPSAAGVTCCHLIAACELVRDFDRAGQWCDRVKEYCRKWDHPPLFAVCRTQYAGVLVSQGSWTEAEAELTAAATELNNLRPGWTGLAFVRLADLRRRQGRLDEAAALFQRFEKSVDGTLGLAALALDRRQPDDSERLARRALRAIATGNHTARASALELMILAATAAGHPDRVAAEFLELEALADAVASPALAASLRLAKGAIAAARSEPILAREPLEEAVALFDRAGAPYDALRARLLLAETLRSAGQDDAAGREALEVSKRAKALGASLLADQATALLDQGRRGRTKPAARSTTDLTHREQEVLQQVARGMTNRQIANHLAISEHTVHRHLANVFTKLGLATRAAAVAYAVRRGLG